MNMQISRQVLHLGRYGRLSRDGNLANGTILRVHCSAIQSSWTANYVKNWLENLQNANVAEARMCLLANTNKCLPIVDQWVYINRWVRCRKDGNYNVMQHRLHRPSFTCEVMSWCETGLFSDIFLIFSDILTMSGALHPIKLADNLREPDRNTRKKISAENASCVGLYCIHTERSNNAD